MYTYGELLAEVSERLVGAGSDLLEEGFAWDLTDVAEQRSRYVLDLGLSSARNRKHLCTRRVNPSNARSHHSDRNRNFIAISYS